MQENSNKKRRPKENSNYAKMGHKMKAVRPFNRIDPVSLGVGLITICILASLTYCMIPKDDMMDIPILESQSFSSWSFADPMNGAIEMFASAKKPGRKMTNFHDITGTLRTTTSGTMQTAVEAPRKHLCDTSNPRSDICDVKGDVRVIGKNLSSVMLVTERSEAEKIEPWIVQPYARKWDMESLVHVRQVHVKATNEAPSCKFRHAVPAIVFSTSGYTGNYFHDFTDVLVPLFQTARQFNGEVQLVVADYKFFWINKYEPYIRRLSRYPIIDYDNDDRVHCFDRVIVGLRSDNDLIIEPVKSPMGYSMVDFMKFMRTSYALDRDYALNPATLPGKKPRLLVVARGRTRKFVNLVEIVRMAEGVGFEVVIAEADSNNVAEFARVVNSCDAMMGVHGAGLTNFLFLPMNAVLIQVVPFGELQWIASTYFGEPAKRINLRYFEYTIGVEESTLTEMYPMDDPALKDPKSIQKQGWGKLEAIYLGKQNVKLDVNKFRPVLEQALRHLKEQ